MKPTKNYWKEYQSNYLKLTQHRLIPMRQTNVI